MPELSEGQLCAMEIQTSILEPMIAEESTNVAVVEKGSGSPCWIKKIDKVAKNQNSNETLKERVQAKERAFKQNSKDRKVRNPFAAIAKRRNSSILNRPKLNELDDVTVVQKQTKTKLFRKRRGSSCLSGDECDEDDEVEPTNVEPIIEQLAMGENTAESRALAETAIPVENGYEVERLFDKIIELASMKTMEVSDESDSEISGFSQINNVKNSTTMEEQSAEKSLEQLDLDGRESNMQDDIKYFIGFSPANKSCISDGFGWNEEMRRFYNYSWGGENFREDEIMRRMNRDKRFWVISDTDRNFIETNPDKLEKCINCLSFGHTSAKCPKPRKPLVCYMCGERGHLESRCPNTLCLQCGSKTSNYSNSCRKCINWDCLTCPICKLRGHSFNDCPDKWRRYHSTKKPNALLDSRVIYNKRRYCCFCGRQGHLSDECKNSLYRTEYPAISTEIRSHEKSYHDIIMSPFYQPEIPCRLLFDPKVKVNFGLAAKTTHKQVYGRFLCAVGLGQMIGDSCRINKTQPESVVAVSTTALSITEANCSITTSPAQVPEINESAN